MENQDSLPPCSSDALPATIPPPKRRSHRLAYAFATLAAATSFSGALVYVLFFDPLLGEVRVYAGLMASLACLSSLASLGTHLSILHMLDK